MEKDPREIIRQVGAHLSIKREKEKKEANKWTNLEPPPEGIYTVIIREIKTQNSFNGNKYIRYRLSIKNQPHFANIYKRTMLMDYDIALLSLWNDACRWLEADLVPHLTKRATIDKLLQLDYYKEQAEVHIKPVKAGDDRVFHEVMWLIKNPTRYPPPKWVPEKYHKMYEKKNNTKKNIKGRGWAVRDADNKESTDGSRFRP